MMLEFQQPDRETRDALVFQAMVWLTAATLAALPLLLKAVFLTIAPGLADPSSVNFLRETAFWNIAMASRQVVNRFESEAPTLLGMPQMMRPRLGAIVVVLGATFGAIAAIFSAIIYARHEIGALDELTRMRMQQTLLLLAMPILLLSLAADLASAIARSVRFLGPRN